jgi:hypothetical protein
MPTGCNMGGLKQLEAYTYVGEFVELQEFFEYSSRRNMLLQ